MSVPTSVPSSVRDSAEHWNLSWEVPLPSGSESGWQEPHPLALLLLLAQVPPTELLPWPQFPSGNTELSLFVLRLLLLPLPL